MILSIKQQLKRIGLIFAKSGKYPSGLFPFGKHKGKSLQYVAENDLAYMKYVVEEGLVKNKFLSSLRLAIKIKEMK